MKLSGECRFKVQAPFLRRLGYPGRYPPALARRTGWRKLIIDSPHLENTVLVALTDEREVELFDRTEFTTLMEQVQAAQSNMNLRPHQEAFYRGHRSTGYKLLPSLYRQRLREGERIDMLERRMFFEFRTRARHLYDSPTDWDILFHMQHHGVPTRLLDWTSVFGVALYFALLNYDDN